MTTETLGRAMLRRLHCVAPLFPRVSFQPVAPLCHRASLSAMRRFTTNLTPEDTAITNVKAKWQLNYGGDAGEKKWEVPSTPLHATALF